MLDRNKMQKQLGKYTGGALIVAGLVLLAMIVSAASSFTGNEVIGTRTIRIGQLNLVELGRQVVDGQTAAVITYLPGLVWYFAVSVFLGILLALFQSQKQ